MSTTPDSPPPRGWYTDPQLPRIDRWWDGEQWTNFTHRAPGSMSAGPRYTRSYWVGPNVAAGRSKMFTYIATLLLLAVIVYLPFAASPYVKIPGALWIALGGFVLAGAAEVLVIVFAASEIGRAHV